MALLRSPRQIGAVAPSGKSLARAMAMTANPKGKRILEIGPGTGVITEALLAHGASKEQLLLLERDRKLAAYLNQKFPEIKVIAGDAQTACYLIEPESSGNIDTIVSSLPLRNVREAQKLALLKQLFSLLDEKGFLVQYTYSARAPISKKLAIHLGVKGERAAAVFKNLPPASVWKYAQTEPINFKSEPQI